jgi:hypothetical protein
MICLVIPRRGSVVIQLIVAYVSAEADSPRNGDWRACRSRAAQASSNHIYVSGYHGELLAGCIRMIADVAIDLVSGRTLVPSRGRS